MMKARNKYQELYKYGYEAYVQHSFEKTWHSSDKIPRLDAKGCSKILTLHFAHMSNPVGMDTPEQCEVGFFHAQAGPYGKWYTLESGYTENNGAAMILYGVDGWKQCDRPEQIWIDTMRKARAKIEAGDFFF